MSAEVGAAEGGGGGARREVTLLDYFYFIACVSSFARRPCSPPSRGVWGELEAISARTSLSRSSMVHPHLSSLSSRYRLATVSVRLHFELVDLELPAPQGWSYLYPDRKPTETNDANGLCPLANTSSSPHHLIVCTVSPYHR